MNVDVDGLRAAAEAVELEADWYEPTAYIDTRNPQDVGFIAAASPDVVLALLDRLAEVEGQLERTEQQIHEPGGFIDRVAAAEQALSDLRHAVDPRCPFHGRHPALTYTSTTRCSCPQAHVTARLSASGAESDHGDRREGEGLA